MQLGFARQKAKKSERSRAISSPSSAFVNCLSPLLLSFFLSLVLFFAVLTRGGGELFSMTDTRL